MWTLGRKYVLVSENGAQIRHFSENVHVVTSHSWRNFVETRRIRWRDRKLFQKLDTDMGSHVKRCIQPHLRMPKKFRIYVGTTVTVNTSHNLCISQISVLRHGFVCKNLHTEKVLQVKSFGCTSFRVGQKWNTRCDMLNVTHGHVFISQQVNDHHSRRRRRCGQPAMQQSAGAGERNSSDSLEDRNAGAQLNDSFQFNQATMVTLEHKSTTEGATFDKQRGLGI